MLYNFVGVSVQNEKPSFYMRVWRNGRRDRLRIYCRMTCRFKSCHPHQCVVLCATIISQRRILLMIVYVKSNSEDNPPEVVGCWASP